MKIILEKDLSVSLVEPSWSCSSSVLARVCSELSGSCSELRVSSQAVELIWRMLLPSGGGCLTESGSDLVERPALGLRYFEVREDKEQEQQHSEDDEDVGATLLL